MSSSTAATPTISESSHSPLRDPEVHVGRQPHEHDGSLRSHAHHGENHDELRVTMVPAGEPSRSVQTYCENVEVFTHKLTKLCTTLEGLGPSWSHALSCAQRSRSFGISTWDFTESSSLLPSRRYGKPLLLKLQASTAPLNKAAGGLLTRLCLLAVYRPRSFPAPPVLVMVMVMVPVPMIARAAPVVSLATSLTTAPRPVVDEREDLLVETQGTRTHGSLENHRSGARIA